MNRYFLLFILASAGLMNGANIALAQVSLSEDREAVLHRAERFQIVPVAEIVGSFAHVADPFFADLKVKEAETLAAEEAAEMRVSLSDREILQELADQLRPTGVIRFNAEDHLLFGERRVKAGDFLSMQYQGINYRVEVVRIDSRAFMLRLNGEVISKRIQ